MLLLGDCNFNLLLCVISHKFNGTCFTECHGAHTMSTHSKFHDNSFAQRNQRRCWAIPFVIDQLFDTKSELSSDFGLLRLASAPKPNDSENENDLYCSVRRLYWLTTTNDIINGARILNPRCPKQRENAQEFRLTQCASGMELSKQCFWFLFSSSRIRVCVYFLVDCFID